MNRLADLRKKSNLSQADLGKIMGAAQNTISNWENENRKIDTDSLKFLANYFNVSVDYLLGRTDEKNPPIMFEGGLNPPKSTGGVWVPVLGQVPAGTPIEAIEDILDYEEITMEMAARGEIAALKVRGDSMEPRIKDGDVVIVRRQPDAETGDTVVVFVNGDDATIKKFKKRPEGIMLIPNNPAFEPMFFNNKQIRDLPVTIWGKVIELRGKF